MADDKLINILRPTLIKAQREVAAYEKKRDAMRGRVNLAEANRAGTGSILTAETMGQKLFNAASFLSAGAKEAACKTELAMIERQIRGFKEEFGVELYPVFQSMEDNEGWLPTDRKVRSLYDQAREDIAQMEKSKEEKREQIRQLEGLEGSGLTPPAVPAVQTSQAAVAAPMAVATPVGTPVPSSQLNQTAPSQWTTGAAESSNTSYGLSYGSSSSSQPTPLYGSSQPSINYGAPAVDNTFGAIETTTNKQPTQSQTGFGFIQNQPAQPAPTTVPPPTNHMNVQQPTSQFNTINSASVFDPFDGLSNTPQTNGFSSNAAPAPSAFTSTNASIGYNSTPASSVANGNSNAFDPFSKTSNSSALSDADMNLFKY